MKKPISALMAIIMTLSVISPLFIISSAANVKAGKTKYVCTKMVFTDSWGDKETYSAEYDKNGYITKASVKGDYSNASYKYSYDSNGRLSSVKCSNGLEELYTYYSNGDLKTKKEKYDGETIYSHTYSYKYDEKGNLTYRADTFKEDSELGEDDRIIKNTNKYSYDKNGNLTADSYSLYGEKYKTTYKYDSKNRLLKSSDGSFSCSYDSNGNVKSKKIGNYLSAAITYANGKPSKTKFSEFGDVYSTVSYKFNKNGQLTEKTYSDRKTTYTYDKNGNLTKFETLKGKKCVEKATYTYAAIPVNTAITTGGVAIFNYKTSFTATGKAITPTVTSHFIYNSSDPMGDPVEPVVFDASPEHNINIPYFLFQGIDYTVKCSSNKNPGTGKIVINFIDPTIEDVTLTFKIAPAKVKNLSVESKKSGVVNVKWDKVTGAKYYYVQSSTDGKTWTTEKIAETNSATLKSLKKGKKYQIRVRAYDSSKKISGKVSNTEYITVKK